MLRDTKDRMLGRVQRLAEVYGSSARFTPEGSEGKEGDDPLDKAIESSEAASKTPEEQKAIDEARKSEQQLEQERANTRRANEATNQAQATVRAVQAERDDLAQKLADAEAKAAEAGIEDVKLDPDEYEGGDLKLVRAIEAVKKQIEAKDTRIAGLEKKAQTFEQQANANAARTESKSQYEELLTEMDADYGPDCRNEAIKKFTEMRTSGKVNVNRPSLATRALEKCYKEVKAAKDKAEPGRKKPKVDLDMGSGGGSGVNLGKVEIKEGSLDEVAKQYAAAGTSGSG